jgi:2,4-diketo-3-deoxy-L-fuconate hydrolase
MRVANVAGRPHIVVDGGMVDVSTASAGRFPADPLGLLERWPEFREWAGHAALADPVPVPVWAPPCRVRARSSPSG